MTQNERKIIDMRSELAKLAVGDIVDVMTLEGPPAIPAINYQNLTDIADDEPFGEACVSSEQHIKQILGEEVAQNCFSPSFGSRSTGLVIYIEPNNLSERPVCVISRDEEKIRETIYFRNAQGVNEFDRSTAFEKNTTSFKKYNSKLMKVGL